MNTRLVHICEVCERTEIMTPDEAFNEGWDYPPRMGTFGIVSPRICGECLITETAWWALACEKKGINKLSEKQKETIKRILDEPGSILPKGRNYI